MAFILLRQCGQQLPLKVVI